MTIFVVSLPMVRNLQRSRALNQLISVLFYFHKGDYQR